MLRGSSEPLGQPTTRTDLIDYRPDAAAKDSKAELAGLVAELVDMKFRLFKR